MNSNKTLILTEFEKLIPLFSAILNSIKLEVYDGDSPLSSLGALKNKIKKDGNLSFIRKEILSIITNYGSPFIIIDMITDIDIDNNERTKIFKTFLLSYIIIMESEQFKDTSCNMLILIDKKNYELFNPKYSKPQNILSMLKTNDERINKIINNYMTDQNKFSKNFNMLLINAEKDTSLLKSELTLFSNIIKTRTNSGNKQSDKTIKPIGAKTSAAQAADVIIHLGGLLYKNNEEPVEYDENQNLTEKEIYICGNFTGYTRLEVVKRLLELMKRNFKNDFNFKNENSIIINIPKDSEIDSTIPTTIAQLISKELHSYKNIRIKIPMITYQEIQRVAGFHMIEKNIIILNS